MDYKMTQKVYKTPESSELSEVSDVSLTREFKRYQTNPSVPYHIDTTVKHRKIEGVKGNFMIIADTESGELAAEAKPSGFYTVDFVDREKFVKLFISGVQAFSGLSSAGIKVFEVLYREIQNNANSDKITINFDYAKTIIKMSRRTFFNGIKELLMRGFIYKTMVLNQYFININYMFNGDRLAFVKEFRLKEQKEKQMTQQQE
jgi:hypothetical protein